jgi:hypothetical protein
MRAFFFFFFFFFFFVVVCAGIVCGISKILIYWLFFGVNYLCLSILRLVDVKLEENEKKVKIASGFVLQVLTYSTTSKLLSSTNSGGDFVCIEYGVM